MKPFNIQKRKIFYEKYYDFSVEDQSNVIFTDESKICLEPFTIKKWMTKEERK